MSVEKTITFEEVPYLQVYTHVVQNINNMEAGWVWIYLLSKPKDWDVIKEHLKNKFKIGDDKIKSIFAYLAAHKLIEYIRHKDENGKYVKHETRVLNGSKFITDQELEELSTKEKPTGVIFHPMANHSSGNRALQIKENTYKRKKTKNRESSLSVFIPNDENIFLAKELGIDIAKELNSFKERHRREKTQYEFGRWLKDAKMYKDKNKNIQDTTNTTYAGIRDVTKERLERELLSLNNQLHKDNSHGSEATRNQSRGNSVQKVEGYLPF